MTSLTDKLCIKNTDNAWGTIGSKYSYVYRNLGAFGISTEARRILDQLLYKTRARAQHEVEKCNI